MSKKNQDKADSNNKVIADNRRATHRYAIADKLEAGLVLSGTEVKACREGRVVLGDAYVMVRQNEAWLENAHISEYTKGNIYNHEPVHKRKLLLHAREIARLETRIREKGETAVPLSMYFKNGRVKIEVGIGKGKTDIDRRDTIKERDTKRELQRVMRRASR
jgi:SsrA-binding protein